MKNLIVLLIILNSHYSFANTYVKTTVTALEPTNRDFVFEVKTPHFQKVILDCASFIAGITFYEEKKILYNFYLEGDNCQRMFDFLNETLVAKQVPCFEIEVETNTLMVSINPECH